MITQYFPIAGMIKGIGCPFARMGMKRRFAQSHRRNRWLSADGTLTRPESLKGDRMRRRAFITLLGGAAAEALAASRSVVAQTSERTYRVALFTALPPASDIAGLGPIAPDIRAFVEAMRGFGYAEGRNLVLERWPQQARVERYGEIAADLARRKLDVIVTIDNAMVQEMKRVTGPIPIVMAASSNPVELGIVASLARPGGSITGLTSDTGTELEVKRLQLLKEVVPAATRVAYLGLRSDWTSLQGQSIRSAASVFGVTLIRAEPAPQTYIDAFALIARDRSHGLFVAANPMNHANRQIIADFATEHRLPGMNPAREFVEAGGLMSYGASISRHVRRAVGLCRQDPEGRQARRPRRPAADQVRDGAQPEDSARAGPDDRTPPARPSRRDNRIIKREVFAAMQRCLLWVNERTRSRGRVLRDGPCLMGTAAR